MADKVRLAEHAHRRSVVVADDDETYVGLGECESGCSYLRVRADHPQPRRCHGM
jgi:hypothetical protein